MNTKQKTLFSIIGSLLILIIIGLSIAIVLVATSARMGSSMRITYDATNVACTIDATASIMNGSDKVSDIDVTPRSVSAKATDSPNDVGEGGDKTHNIGDMSFAEAKLSVGHNAQYIFTITNDANVGGKAIQAKYSFATINFEEQNVIVKIGSSVDNVSEVTLENLNYVTGSINPKQSETIVLIIAVRDYNQEVNLDMVNIISVSQVKA